MADNTVYRYWLLSNSTISQGTKARLCDYFGDAYHVYSSSQKELKESGILNNDKLSLFLEQRRNCNIYEILEKIMDSPFSFVTEEEKTYPELLRKIYNHPYGIYYLGRLPENDESCIAMVGARNCSAYGEKMAKELGKALSENGIWVVSGMARGIDSASHRGALLAGGKTVAVLGSGIDVVYPKQNAGLYEEIAQNGCIISEYSPGTPAVNHHFPARNRIISGLSEKVIVVEARAKSGSLITADFALDQGRDVYVVPGRMTDPLSEGCNQLINQGAGIITSVNSFIYDDLELSKQERFGILSENNKHFVLEKQELLVYSCLDFYPRSLAQIQIDTGVDYLQLLSIIYEMIRKGIIREVFKNQYVKNN